jgi:hypothetical protein
MEGADDLDEPAPLELPLGDLDRAALASHCAAVAHHMAAMARLFDPAAKPAAAPGAEARKVKKVVDDVLRPKRELSAYNLFMQARLLQVKAEVRACVWRCLCARRACVRACVRACSCCVAARMCSVPSQAATRGYPRAEKNAAPPPLQRPELTHTQAFGVAAHEVTT